MKKIFFGIALVMLVTLVIGCGKKGLVGKWRQDGYSVDYYFIFNEDKTCSYEMSGAKRVCTYNDDGSKITVYYKGNPNPNIYEYTIDGNALTIKDSYNNVIKYTRK